MGSTSATIAALEYGADFFRVRQVTRVALINSSIWGGLSISKRVMGYLHFNIVLSYDREPSGLVLVSIQASILSCPYH